MTTDLERPTPDRSPGGVDPERARIEAEMRATLQKGYTDVGSDFRQLRGLFADVVESLNGALSGLSAQTLDETHLRKSLSLLARLDVDAARDGAARGAQDAEPEVAAPISSNAAEDSDAAHRVVGNLITALQFEDIASQILERSRVRLTVLEMFTAAVLFGTVSHAICRAEKERDAAALSRLDEQIHWHRELLQEVLSRKVAQTSMQPGDVELF